MKRFVVLENLKIVDLNKDNAGLNKIINSFDTLREAKDYVYLNNIGLYNLSIFGK